MCCLGSASECILHSCVAMLTVCLGTKDWNWFFPENHDGTQTELNWQISRKSCFTRQFCLEFPRSLSWWTVACSWILFARPTAVVECCDECLSMTDKVNKAQTQKLWGIDKKSWSLRKEHTHKCLLPGFVLHTFPVAVAKSIVPRRERWRRQRSSNKLFRKRCQPWRTSPRRSSVFVRNVFFEAMSWPCRDMQSWCDNLSRYFSLQESLPDSRRTLHLQSQEEGQIRKEQSQVWKKGEAPSDLGGDVGIQQ